jgi:site-specific recombinase XerD
MLENWLLEEGLQATIEAVDTEVASRFRLQQIVGKMAPATGNKHINALRSFWKWLCVHGSATSNPWLGKSLPKARKSWRSSS